MRERSPEDHLKMKKAGRAFETKLKAEAQHEQELGPMHQTAFAAGADWQREQDGDLATKVAARLIEYCGRVFDDGIEEFDDDTAADITGYVLKSTTPPGYRSTNYAERDLKKVTLCCEPVPSANTKHAQKRRGTDEYPVN